MCYETNFSLPRNQDPALKEHMKNALTPFDQFKSLKFIKEKVTLNDIDVSHYEIIIKKIKRM